VLRRGRPGVVVITAENMARRYGRHAPPIKGFTVGEELVAATGVAREVWWRGVRGSAGMADNGSSAHAAQSQECSAAFGRIEVGK
jgi:hypothetical protein